MTDAAGLLLRWQYSFGSGKGIICAACCKDEEGGGNKRRLHHLYQNPR